MADRAEAPEGEAAGPAALLDELQDDHDELADMLERMLDAEEQQDLREVYGLHAEGEADAGADIRDASGSDLDSGSSENLFLEEAPAPEEDPFHESADEVLEAVPEVEEEGVLPELDDRDPPRVNREAFFGKLRPKNSLEARDVFAINCKGALEGGLFVEDCTEKDDRGQFVTLGRIWLTFAGRAFEARCNIHKGCKLLLNNRGVEPAQIEADLISWVAAAGCHSLGSHADLARRIKVELYGMRVRSG